MAPQSAKGKPGKYVPNRLINVMGILDGEQGQVNKAEA